METKVLVKEKFGGYKVLAKRIKIVEILDSVVYFL